MIFVTLGTQKFQMNRLLKLVDGLLSDAKLQAQVIAQIGQSDYVPRHFAFHRFLDKQEFVRHISQAEVVITQGGVGAIMTALKLRKPTIVVPRLAKYGEHVDDHQREIAHAFAKKGYVICCDDGDNLGELIALCSVKQFPEYVSQTDKITYLINNYLEKQRIS